MFQIDGKELFRHIKTFRPLSKFMPLPRTEIPQRRDQLSRGDFISPENIWFTLMEQSYSHDDTNFCFQVNFCHYANIKFRNANIRMSINKIRKCKDSGREQHVKLNLTELFFMIFRFYRGIIFVIFWNSNNFSHNNLKILSACMEEESAWNKRRKTLDR